MKKNNAKSPRLFAKESHQENNETNHETLISGQLVGCFDSISKQGRLEGWAVNQENPNDLIKVYVFVDNVLITHGVANQYREDLIEAQVKPDGKAAFSIALPLTTETQALLQQGATLDIAFDEFQQHLLAESGKLLSPQEIKAILSADAPNATPLSDETQELTALAEEDEAAEELVNPLITHTFQGCLDRISEHGTLEGWTVDQDTPTECVKVYVFVDHVLITSAIADHYRQDLITAQIKEDGRAGFSIPLTLTKENHTLFKVGAKIDIAFDELNHIHIAELSKVLNSQDVSNILSCASSHVISLSTQAKAVIGLVKTCVELEDSLNPALVDLDDEDTQDAPTDSDYQATFLANCKHAGFMVVRTAYQLYKLECDEPLLKFLSHINNPKVLRFCQLECTLFRVIVLTEHDLLNEHAIKLLDTAFYECSSDPEAKQQSRYFSSYIDPTILSFYALLQTKAAQLIHQPQQKADLLGKITFVLSFWLHRLNANSHLSFNFLSLLQSISPALLTRLESQHLLAHLRRDMGDNLGALTYCLNSIQQNTEYWWAYHEAAIILGVLSNNQRLLFKNNLPVLENYFHQAFLLNPYQSKSLREFEQALSNYFSSSHVLTWELAEAGFVAEALAERNEDLQLLTQIITRSYTGKFHNLNYAETNQPQYQHPIANKIVFVGSRGLFQCYYYRVQQKLEQASQMDLPIDYLDITELNQRNWQRLLIDVGVLYVCRIPATINEIKLLCYAKGLGITIVYDIDDLIFDATAFPAALETYAGTIDERTHLHLTMDNPFFLNALKLADVCVASTQPLAKEIGKQVKAHVPIKIHPNVLSYELYDAAQIYKKPPLLKNATPSVTIVYGSATKAHKQSFYEIFLPAVLTVLAQTDAVKLLLIGYFENLLEDIPPLVAEKITILAPTADFMGYINLVKTADINVAVLEQSRLTDTKSEIKWLEAAAFEIPSIVTPTQAYRDVLTADENVLFAATSTEWTSQLLRLIENPLLRKSIGSAAKKLAFEKFSPQVGENILKETVAPFMRGLSVHKTKKRVLLVNVYFYPQSVGGATRVFENQVRGLIERYPDDYEVFVLTSEVDPDIGKPYFVEQYWFDNVLVTRLNIPPRNWVDHEDVQVYDFCVQFFKEYSFDIIHVHSIQVLTASLIDAAITLKIPYVITLHDAWWLSIYQFLVNPKGDLVDHTLPLGGVPEEETGKDWIVKRRRRLQKVLVKANAVVAVSKKFAQLYQEAGFNNVQVHENYVEPFTNTEARHQTTDKIVLGFIGGMSTHKGYDLLKKALEEGHFSNMHLIVINHALHSGEVHTSTWGDTTVEFRAKEKQSEVAKLYAQFDVLLAPSIWPESYGLVTREALQAGLWVIASDRGAIGDCIVEGVNGNIVDVENYLSLMNALKQLPAQLENRVPENPQLSPELFLGNSMENHLQQLVTLYQTALGNAH